MYDNKILINTIFLFFVLLLSHNYMTDCVSEKCEVQASEYPLTLKLKNSLHNTAWYDR